MNYKKYLHNPPHLFMNNTKYFITARTHNKIRFFNTIKAKEKLIDSIFTEFGKNNWVIEDWVVLDNHYHLMADSKKNSDKLPAIIREIHKFTAIWIKKNNRTAKKAEKIWYNYWDTCITYESSYFARINYIWHNPVKHGYVTDPEDWKFGSYYYRFQNEKDDIKKLFKKYPFDKLDLE